MLVASAALFALIFVGPAAVLAQGTTPPAGESLLAGLGFPGLQIIATDEAMDLPAEVAAGRYLVVMVVPEWPSACRARAEHRVKLA